MNETNESGDPGIIGRIERHQPETEVVSGNVTSTVSAEERTKQIESFEATGDQAADVDRLLTISGRAEYAAALSGTSRVDKDGMLYVLRSSRQIIQEQSHAFRSGILVDDKNHPNATLFYRRIPAAEIRAIDKIYAARGMDPRAAGSSNDPLASFWRADRKTPSPERFVELAPLAKKESEVRVQIDESCKELVGIETKLDLLKSELDEKSRRFEAGVSDLADNDYNMEKDKFQQIYSDVKRWIAEAFITLQEQKTILGDMLAQNSHRATDKSFLEALNVTARSFFINVDAKIGQYREIVDAFGQRVDSLEWL